MVNHIFDNFAEFRVKLHRVISVNACDYIRAFADVGLIFFTPLNPLVVLVTFHFSLLYYCAASR